MKRRNFITQAATAGGTTLAATGVAHAAKQALPETGLLRIGVVALGDNSHMNYEIWAPMINQKVPKKWPVGRTTRMLITHCWDRDPEIAADFAKKYECEAVDRYDGMVGKVDGMIFAGFKSSDNMMGTCPGYGVKPPKFSRFFSIFSRTGPRPWQKPTTR